MRGIFFSPRARRRLTWIGAGLLAVVAAVIVGVKWSNTAEQPPNTFAPG